MGSFVDFQSVGGVSVEDNFQYIIPQLNFSCNGTVSQWKVGLEEGNVDEEVHLQIWRSVGEEEYSRVTEEVYTKTIEIERIATVPVSMSVMAGDMVGFYGQIHTLPNVGLTIFSSGVDPTTSLGSLSSTVGPSPYISVVFGE